MIKNDSWVQTFLKNELVKQRYVSLELFTPVKFRPFILQSVTAANKLELEPVNRTTANNKYLTGCW